MKLDLSTGCLVTVSQGELDRRIAGIRRILKEAGAGLLMAVCPAKGGWRNYLTGTDGPGRPSEGAVLIGLSGDVIVVNGGSLVPRGAVGERNYAMAGGVEGEGFSGYGSCEGFSADLIEEMLGGRKVLAIANMRYLRADLYRYLKANLPDVEIRDFSCEAETFRAVKSEEELHILEDSARMMDKLFAGAGIYINPMKYEREIVTDLRYAAYRLGAGGVDHQISVPMELTSGPEEQLTYPGKLVVLGDRVNLKAFSIGNDGYYGGMARSYVLGKPSGEDEKLWEAAVKIQKKAAALLKPGTVLADVAKKVNEELADAGYRPDRRTMIHGIGCAAQENPQTFEERPMPLQENMVLYVGPVVDDGKRPALSCGDMYVVKKDGAVRMTAYPQNLIQLY